MFPLKEEVKKVTAEEIQNEKMDDRLRREREIKRERSEEEERRRIKREEEEREKEEKKIRMERLLADK